MRVVPLAFLLFLGAFVPCARADSATILQGLSQTLGAVVQLPKAMLQHGVSDPFPLGLVTGAVSGTYQTVSGVVSGTMRMAAGAAPYAKYLVFFI
jgi:hypothetical protein